MHGGYNSSGLLGFFELHIVFLGHVCLCWTGIQEVMFG